MLAYLFTRTPLRALDINTPGGGRRVAFLLAILIALAVVGHAAS